MEDKESMRLDLEKFHKLKRRLDALEEELRTVHAEWIEIHQENSTIIGHQHQRRHQELMSREIEILKEVKQVIDWTIKMMAAGAGLT